MHLFDMAAGIAHHELRPAMRVTGMARDEGVQAFNFVNEPARLQKLDSAINGRRFRIWKMFPERGQNIIRHNRVFAFRDNGQYKAALLGKSRALRLAPRFHFSQ